MGTAFFITATDEVGGAEVQAVGQARLARELGYSVRLVSLGSKAKGDRVAPLADLAGSVGLAQAPLLRASARDPRRGATALAIAALIRQARRGDILIGLTYFPNLVASAAGWALRTTSVWQQRDLGLVPMHAHLDRVLCRRATHILGNSNEACTYAASLAPGRQPILLPNLADPRRARHTVSQSSSAGTFHALSVANFGRAKDHDLLVRAWAIALPWLVQIPTRPILTLVGRPGETLEATEALVDELNLTGTVRFVTSCSDPCRFYEQASIYVCSSASESRSNAVDEAMAAGLPVAGPPLAALSAQLSREGRVLLAPVRSPEALAAKICDVAADPATGLSIGYANQTAITDLHRHAKQAWSAFFNEIMAGGSRE